MGVLVQPPRQSVARMADPPATMAADPNDPTTTTKMVDTAPPQLSPLSGAYLLIVVGEPFSEEHKKLILQKIQQGLYTWNSGDTHVDIETELNVISDCAPPGEEARGGERLIQFATENLVTEVLIHPQVNTLQQCMKNMLASFTKHRHIIHAGYTFAGQGSWILQDGTFSFEDFATAFEEYDVQRVIRSYENSISINVHCCQEGEGKQDKIRQQPFAKLCQIEVNPNSEMKESNSVAEFISYLEPFLQPQSIQERLPPSDVVGNIRFSHPTLYVFPGGQGDSALFGINGFNMLIDGGFSRKACFWDFTRHLDRLDAILITRLSDENTQGISAVLERKSVNPVYPQIGHFFANILETKTKEKEQEDERDKLLVNVISEGNTMIENLRILNLKPQICFRDNVCDPINLYHKVGHGKLDMYVLNPSKESQEVKEFLARWEEKNSHLGSFKSGINVDGKELWLPIANLVSICALLIWQPANPNDTITRLLFPGSTPQNKIFKGLEKLRKLECLKYPACSPSTLKENKTHSRSEKKKKMQRNDSKNLQPDNSNVERKEKLAKRRQEKAKKEKEERERQEKEKKEEREKRDKEKEEQDKVEKEKKDKERMEKLEKKKRSDKEKRDKERQERREKEAAAKQEKEEKLKKEAAAKKEKDDKDASAKKEKEEKDAALKKDKEEKLKKEQANKKEISEPKITEKMNKKKTSTAITKTKTKEITTKTRKTEVTNDTATSSRKIMPSKPLMTKSSTPPSSKLKKDENNKKVVETRKATFAAKTQKSKADSEEKAKPKKIVGSKSRNIAGSKTSAKTSSTIPDEERKVDEKSVAEKVSEAIASGEIDDSRVVKDDDEDKESIVEKDQIEDMETCPVDDLEAGKDNEDDEDDIELQRIKDEDDEDVEENHAPVPDIAEKMIDAVKDIKKDPEQKNVPGNLVLEKEKISYSHVKTPDEVDDLPEHEVVIPDSHVMDEINSEMCGDLEEKIALDESEKESDVCKKEIVNEKSEGSVEAVRDNEIVEVAVEQKCMQVDATTPLNENNIEDHLNKVNEPECVEEKQYITTDKDKETDEKDFDGENDKDASTEKVTEKESLDKKDEKDTDEKDDLVKESENDVDNSTKTVDDDSEEEDLMIKPGFLKVIVFKASELVNKDMIGKSDPFLKMKFRDQELKSRTVRNSLEPEWNFSANLIISSSNENSDIVLEVYDDDFGKENFIGSYTFSLKQAINDTDKEAVWYDLVGCKTGKVSFSTFYSPDDDQEEDDNETEKCNEKEIDQINKKEDMSLDNTQEEPKSVDKELPEKEKKEEDKTDSTATTIKDKELSSKASDKDIKGLEIEPEIKAAETNDETEQSESSSDDHSESSDSSEQSKDDQKEVNDKEGIHADKGSIESEKEKGSDDKDTAPDSFINEIYTSEGRL